MEKTAAAEYSGTVCPPDARSSGFTSDSFSGSYIHKATSLDTHFPSLKRKRLSEYKQNEFQFPLKVPIAFRDALMCTAVIGSLPHFPQMKILGLMA